MEEPAAGGYDALLTTPPPPPSCPICMEPWGCGGGGHRICCIPCGHVYGRSCLETWLHRSGPDTAKCPQCGEKFEHKLIINLYVPGNLWDGCFQELKERSVSILKDQAAESLADYEKLKAFLKEQSEVMRDKMADMDSRITDGMQRVWNKKMSTLHANLTSMKEQMKKMSREEKATAADVVGFMERSFPELSEFSYPLFSASASAPAPPTEMDSENAQGHLDSLVPKPMAAPPGRADHVKRKRRRGT